MLSKYPISKTRRPMIAAVLSNVLLEIINSEFKKHDRKAMQLCLRIPNALGWSEVKSPQQIKQFLGRR